MRVFTPGSARRTLDAVRPSAEAMACAWRSMELLRPARVACDQPVDREYFLWAERLQRATDSLREAGVLVKDARAGLLDFPARRAGRLVMLCWKVGEPALDFWHEVEAGFAGRQRVDEDGPWEAAPVGESA